MTFYIYIYIYIQIGFRRSLVAFMIFALSHLSSYHLIKCYMLSTFWDMLDLCVSYNQFVIGSMYTMNVW